MVADCTEKRKMRGYPMSSTFSSIQQRLDGGFYDEAAQLLYQYVYEHLQPSLTTIEASQINKLLQQFPTPYHDIEPTIIFIHAHCALAVTQIEIAATLLQRAALFYLQQQAIAKAADCYYQLAAIYRQLENYATAYAYICEVGRLLDQVYDDALKAQLALQLAELCPDIGQLQEANSYANQALDFFRQHNRANDQFRAMILLFHIHLRLGEYRAAEARLEIAKRLYLAQLHGTQLSPLQFALAIAESQLNWHRGELDFALTKAGEARYVAERHNLQKEQIQALLVIAELHAAQQRYQKAFELFSIIHHLLEQMEIHTKFALILQEAWCQLMMNNLESARRHIEHAMQRVTPNQLASCHVHLAILHILAGHYYVAQDLLHTAYRYFEESKERLNSRVIEWYLAFVAIKTKHNAQARELLSDNLSWFLAQNVHSFPRWWHPDIVAQCCLWALKENIHPVVAERVLIALGENTADNMNTLLQELQELQHSSDLITQQRAAYILETINQHVSADLSNIRDQRVKSSLEMLLAEGTLLPTGFCRLQKELTTASQQQRSNPVLLAVFGMYIDDMPQSEISHRLGRAPATIRNYITTIYHQFNLMREDYPSLLLRKRQLLKLASERGYIPQR